MKILPFVVSYVLVSGFIIAQLPYMNQGDNFLHSANAKLIDIYGNLPPYSNTYTYSYPSFFILSSISSRILGIEIMYLNTLPVAWLHIIVALTLYVFLKEALDRKDKVLAPLICTFTFLGNFHLTYFLSIITPRLFVTPLFYLFLYTMFKEKSKAMKVISMLLLGAIIIGHPITPFYIILFMAGFLIYAQDKYYVSRFRSLILILIPWIAWLIYRAGYDFEWGIKLIFGQLESPWHTTYGISSPFIQEQMDFSKDFITSLLRAYRLLIMVFPYLIGGAVGAFYILCTISVRGGRMSSRKTLLSFASIFMFIGSLLFYVISGRGHDYFYLFSYPIFLSLAFSAVATIIHSSPKFRKIKMNGYSLFITIVLIVSIIALPLSFLSIHSTRIYIGSSDYSGLTFLAIFGPDKDISTTSDIFYDYAFFNPSYFWPGKAGRSLPIYATPQDLIEQSRRIPYIFESDIAVRSSKQVFGLYFSGLSPDFWKNVDNHLAENRNKIYDNGYMLMWSK
jgi:hypothetical protein